MLWLGRGTIFEVPINCLVSNNYYVTGTVPGVVFPFLLRETLKHKVGKSKFTAVSMWNTEFILVLLFTNDYIIPHSNNCKPAFDPPCTNSILQK